MTFFVKYDLATGAFKGAGSCPPEQIANQATPGIGVIESAADVLIASEQDGRTVISVDLAPVRTHLRDRIDAEAGATRMHFITDVPGQAQSYAKKEAEARAWTPGDDTAHPDLYPFMIAEATVRGVSVAQVRSEIVAQVDALIPIAARIEAHRAAAKIAVSAASAIPEMIAAATVDWNSLIEA
jgi:hypothetical protein